MQRTAHLHDAIANAHLSEAAGVVDDATPLDAAVDMLDAHPTAGEAPMGRLLCAGEFPSSRFPRRYDDLTWSSVNARKPRAWSKRLPAGKG